MVKANDVGIKVAFIPLMYLVMNVVSVIAAIPVGSLSDRVGKERILVIGFVIYALVYFGFGKVSHDLAITLLFAFYGLYSAATDSIQKAFVTDIIDRNKKGTGLGIYNALLGITLLPASLIAGSLYDKVNSRIPFYFGSAMAALAAVLMVVFIMTGKRTERVAGENLKI